MKRWLSLVLLLWLGVEFVWVRRVEAREIELLKDPSFSNGVVVGYGNTYPNSLDYACIDRWRNVLPGYDEIKWMFTEVSERFYFCDNGATPEVMADRIVYLSPNYGMKKLTIDREAGTLRMEYDTSWEWRGGCNLCKPWSDVDPSLPRYGDPLTNWPHFLVEQLLSSTYTPGPYFQAPDSIPPEERVGLERYQRVEFTGEFKWNSSEKVRPDFNCPPGDWKPNSCEEEVCREDCEVIPDHAIFYVGFILWRKEFLDSSTPDTPNVVYELLPVLYTEDGVVNIGGREEYVMGDQFGDRTFFAKLGEGVTGEAFPLKRGRWVGSKVEVVEFSKEVLRKINPELVPDEYFIAGILIGWEIWGGYRTDIEIRNVSLKAFSWEGDLNEDGKVDIRDVKRAAFLYSISDESGDLNGDGRVNAMDVARVMGLVE